MSSTTTRISLVMLLAAVMLLTGAAFAYAAPTIPVGWGWADGPHSSYPGYCLGCHTGFAAGSPPAITAGSRPTHRDRGSNCSQCHRITMPAPPPPSRVPVTYVKGANRYATAIAVSHASFPATAPCVVLATGADFPDALCAAPLAKAYGGPILLVAPGSGLTAELSAEIDRLHPSRVFVVGSERAVSAGVAAQAAAKPWAPSVTRLGGAGRFDTAGLVAHQVKLKLGHVSKVVVAYGRNYPDALSAAPLAAAQGWPILLTETNALPPATAVALADSAATSSLVVGGPNAVSDAVMSMLPSALRKGGGTRYDTCGLLADYAVSLGMKYTTLFSTVGNNFPDALAAGPMVAGRNGVLLLTDPSTVPGAISSRLATNKMAVQSLVIVGGAVPTTCVTRMSSFLN
ncbi:MAG TPA: cell wall-binding repeat-containing protein [Coriobacteriia bacterium]|jgi:putative cell wall-binding protein